MLKWFAGGFGAVFGGLTAAMVGAASGDLLVRYSPAPVVLTAGQSTTLKNFAASSGCWDTDAALLRNVQFQLAPNGQGGTVWLANCSGAKTRAPASIGANEELQVVGIAP